MGFTEISVTENSHPYVAAWWPSGHNIGWEHAQIIEKFHFLDAVANDKPLSPYLATLEDGYRTAVVIDAMRQSDRLGTRVDIRGEWCAGGRDDACVARTPDSLFLGACTRSSGAGEWTQKQKTDSIRNSRVLFDKLKAKMASQKTIAERANRGVNPFHTIRTLAQADGAYDGLTKSAEQDDTT